MESQPEIWSFNKGAWTQVPHPQPGHNHNAEFLQSAGWDFAFQTGGGDGTITTVWKEGTGRSYLVLCESESEFQWDDILCVDSPSLIQYLAMLLPVVKEPFSSRT
jgi:hypothetical protein